MPAVSLTGLILPRGLNLNISPTSTFTAKNLPNGLSMTCAVAVQKSDVVVDCELNQFEPRRDLIHVWTHGSYIARTLLSVHGFARGCGLSVVLDGIIDVDGKLKPVLPLDFELAALCSAFSLKSDEKSISELVASDKNLALALTDIVQANSNSFAIPVNCGRAIEALRQYFYLPEHKKEREPSWQKMNGSLNLTRDYVGYIMSRSVGPRHGSTEGFDGDVTMEILRRTWTITNRYISFRRASDTPLSPDAFPTL